jgi:hypothetical protein
MKHSSYLGEIKRVRSGFDEEWTCLVQVICCCICSYSGRIPKWNAVIMALNAKWSTIRWSISNREGDHFIKKKIFYLPAGWSRQGKGWRRLNSDWSDSFFHKFHLNSYAQSVESIPVTTMALAVLQTGCWINKTADNKLVSFITAVQKYLDELRFLADFARW